MRAVLDIPQITDHRRFWDKATIGDGCWEWQACRQPNGYGKFGIGGRPYMAHRVAYTLAYGPIVGDLHIDHLCENKRCVRPSHLELVTTGENTRRHFAQVTHCPQGHAYDEKNTYVYNSSRGRARICRACDRYRKRAKRYVEMGS